MKNEKEKETEKTVHELQNHCLLMNNIMYARVEYSSSRYPPPPSSLNRHHNPTNPQSTPPPQPSNYTSHTYPNHKATRNNTVTKRHSHVQSRC